MLIGKRWPFLVAVGSAMAYVGNNYRIGGLDQLRLERKPLASTDHYSEYGSHDMGLGSHEMGLEAFPMPVSNARPFPTANGSSGGLREAAGGLNSGLENSPPWQSQLNVGEKLAVMQDRLAKKIGELAQPPGSGSSLPLAPPLSLPPDMERTRPVSAAQGENRLGGSGSTKQSASQLARSSVFDSQAPTLRVASYCVQGLGATHIAKPHVMEILIAILRQFDIVALQGVQSERDDILPLIVERLNQSGRKIDYLIGPRVGPEGARQQFAFLFDTSRIETDRYQLYTVDDPENLVTYEPLVAWFRCREVPASQAFTFTLVNVRVDPQRAQQEQAVLPNLIHAVVNDGRQEDDVIVLGDFAGNAGSISALNVESIRHALRDIPTDVSGERMLSSILMPAHATCEYTGRSGVLDFLRKYNLSLERAMEISQQMPVWAEFYAVEGAQPGRVAPPPGNSVIH